MTNDIRWQGALKVFSQIKGFVKKKEIILTDVKTTIKPKIVQVEDVAKLLINVLYFSKNPLERLSENGFGGVSRVANVVRRRRGDVRDDESVEKRGENSQRD